MEPSDTLPSVGVEQDEVASVTDTAADPDDDAGSEATVVGGDEISFPDEGPIVQDAPEVSGDSASNLSGHDHGASAHAPSSHQPPPSHYYYSGKIVATEAFQLPPTSRCFIIKPGSFAEVEQIYNSKAIYPPAATRERLRAAAKEGDVYVAVSVNNSRALQGYGIIPKLDADDTGIVDGNLIKRVRFWFIVAYLGENAS
jgi:hypothetical protein